MNDLTFSALEIRILLKSSNKLLSRRDITQLFKKFPKPERETAIQKLIEHGMLIAQEMPKPDARKTPVFYKITDKGQQWVKDYLDNYPQ